MTAFKFDRFFAALPLIAAAHCVGAAASPEPLADCVAPHVANARALNERLTVAFKAWPATDSGVEPTRRRLAEMGEVDQAIIGEVMGAAGQCHTDFAAPEMLPLITEARRIRTRNWEAITAQLDALGWPVVSVYGETADQAAFLVVQHADRNPELQARALAMLESLVKKRETNPENYALLFDRVRVNAGQPQRYGSQGECTEQGWTAKPIEAPESVDARRAEMGLEPMEAYRIKVDPIVCPK